MNLKIILPIALFTMVFASCNKEVNPLNSLYEFDAPLKGLEKTSGLGFIKFRQNPDTARIISLDTWVSKLLPNHNYLLQRAVNPITNLNGCSSTSWLTLGEGLQPSFIVTNGGGYGYAKLWRDISGVPKGTAFYIHFQILDAENMLPVLASDCYTYTVR